MVRATEDMDLGPIGAGTPEDPSPHPVPSDMSDTESKTKADGSGDEECDILDDVDQLIMSIDCKSSEKREEDGETSVEEVASPMAYDDEEEALDSSALPWLDRYETTDRLLKQLEETLSLMEARGINLTTAWDLANSARSLLESADVVQALIYANRSFRLAMEVHRLQDGGGGAAS